MSDWNVYKRVYFSCDLRGAFTLRAECSVNTGKSR
jgi:hypothetical protein